MYDTVCRYRTAQLIDKAEEGLLSWEDIARECLAYMSEDDVADMAFQCEFITIEDDEEGGDE